MTLNEDTIRELLEQATPGPWHVAMLDLHRETGVVDNEHAVANQKLAALAPELAAEVIRLREAIANMHYEYAVQVRIQENGHWHQVTEWNADPNPYKPGHALKHNERLVRRLVSQREVMEP